jgi:hypothetical protein
MQRSMCLPSSAPKLEVRGNLSTVGGTGESLVKGVLIELTAVALSVKPGGRIGSAHIGGDITTTGDNVTAVEVEGDFGSLAVDGTVQASGAGSTGVRLSDDQLDLETLRIDAPNRTA